jgi:ketosteroid isomerase-like protein
VTDDERQVLAAFDDLDRALERRDRAAVEALWVADSDLTFWGSAAPEAAVGPEGLRELLDLLAVVPGSFTLTWSARRVTLSGDVAWVNAEGVAAWERPGERDARLAYRLTAILVRRAGRWLWHTHHGSEPTALDVSVAARDDGGRVHA